MRTAPALAAVLVLALTGCGTSKTNQSTHVKQVLSTPATKTDEAKAQAIVKGCAHGLGTHTGRLRAIKCIAPTKAGQQCVEAKLSSDGVLSRRARARFYQDAATCLVSRKS